MQDKTLLVVEDSLIVNKHIEVCLKAEGYTVYSAFKPKEALDLLKERDFQLILLDVMLNDEIDGITLAREINELYNIPIIYLTALSDKETIERAKITQPYGYIIKPFNESELLTNIEVALHKSKFEQEIKRNRDFLETVLQHINESIIVTDEDGAVEYLNTSAENDLKTSFKELFRKNIDNAIYFSLVPWQDDSNVITYQDIVHSFAEKIEDKTVYLHLKAKGISVPAGDILIRQFYNSSNKGNSIIFIFNDITDRLRKLEIEKELSAKKLSLLIEGQELERARFSKEIHDGLGQILNLIKMKLEGEGKGGSNEETRKMVDEAIREVKRISNNLLPSLLNDFDLPTCLTHLARQYNNMSSTTISMYHQDVPSLSLNTKINGYRIVQEAVNNAIKHGKAKNITIQLNGIGNEIQLTVEDDGSGFNINQIDDLETHHGLQIMKQRVASLNGEINVESDKKLGTMIMVSFPVK